MYGSPHKIDLAFILYYIIIILKHTNGFSLKVCLIPHIYFAIHLLFNIGKK